MKSVFIYDETTSEEFFPTPVNQFTIVENDHKFPQFIKECVKIAHNILIMGEGDPIHSSLYAFFNNGIGLVIAVERE